MKDETMETPEQEIIEASVAKEDAAKKPIVFDNPNAKIVAVDESEAVRTVKDPRAKIYKGFKPGHVFVSRTGPRYVLQEDHSLRRETPKVKGKKKRYKRDFQKS